MTRESARAEGNAFAVFATAIKDTMGISASVPLARKYGYHYTNSIIKMIKIC